MRFANELKMEMLMEMIKHFFLLENSVYVIVYSETNQNIFSLLKLLETVSIKYDET